MGWATDGGGSGMKFFENNFILTWNYGFRVRAFTIHGHCHCFAVSRQNHGTTS